MKTTKLALASALILLGFVASETAFAQHRHRHRHGGLALGLALGVPLGLAYAYRPYYSPYYPPYYDPYYPPVVTYSPPTYIEQSGPQAAPAPQAAPSNYWYFCADSQSYYPYVSQCRSAWQRVSPTPG